MFSFAQFVGRDEGVEKINLLDSAIRIDSFEFIFIFSHSVVATKPLDGLAIHQFNHSQPRKQLISAFLEAWHDKALMSEQLMRCECVYLLVMPCIVNG